MWRASAVSRSDQAGFDAAMEAQRGRARAASKFGEGSRDAVKLPGKTGFSGYDRLNDKGVVTSLIFDGAIVGALRPGQEGQVVLDHTPFYAESGGQIGDAGELIGVAASGAPAHFAVRDTQKIGASYAHVGVLDAGELRVGDVVDARVDSERRISIALNHSATHLLHAALRKVLGPHVEQRVRWSPPTGCASIIRTPKPCRRRNCSASRNSSIQRFAAMRRWRHG